MIRDPSDGSVKPAPSGLDKLKAKHGDNWGIKQPERVPGPAFKAPTPDELKQHYATHNLGFQPKQEGE